ncbi:MAG: MarR family transcriptional regulator [Candidatus Thermoplasmatota archaeon]|nr:MarR family transcriptional regulator [Candidatus Thermoplasmatota archaeon]
MVSDSMTELSARIQRTTDKMIMLKLHMIRARGLMAYQYGILRYLDMHGKQKISDLALFINVKKPTITGIVDTLEEMGLVARTHISGDRRVALVDVTDTGHKFLSSLEDEMSNTILAGLQEVEPACRSELIQLLDAIGLRATEFLKRDLVKTVKK